MSQSSADRARRALRQQLESLEAAGVRQLPKPHGGLISPKKRQAKTPAKPAAMFEEEARLVEAEIASQAAPDQSDSATLAVLQQEVAGCTRCGELASTRTQTV